MSAFAEEPATFTVFTGVTISEQAESPTDTNQSVRIRKSKSGYDVLIKAFIPCSGKFADPWLSVGENPTLVIEKVRSMHAFDHKEECMYALKIAVAEGRLHKKQTLYVVRNQEVVGHVIVP